MDALDLLDDQSNNTPVIGLQGSRRRNRDTNKENEATQKSTLNNISTFNPISQLSQHNQSTTNLSFNNFESNTTGIELGRRKRPTNNEKLSNNPTPTIIKENSKEKEIRKEDDDEGYIPTATKRPNPSQTTAKLDNILNEISNQNQQVVSPLKSSFKNANSRPNSIDFNSKPKEDVQTFRPTLNSTQDLNSQSDIQRLKFENENLKTKIDSLNQLLDQEKRQVNKTWEEDSDKIRKIQQDHDYFLFEVKKKHKQEISEMEESYKRIIDKLEDDKRKLKMEMEKEIFNEKEKVKSFYKEELDKQEQKYKLSVEETKKFYSSQNENLSTRLEQQLELNKLASKVETNSKLFEDMIGKFQSDKEKIINSEKYMIESREKYLNEQEEKLKRVEDNLIVEKETIMKMRKDVEINEIQKRNELREERQRVDKEVQRLSDLQSTLKEMEYNAKEKYEKEKLELTRKTNDAQSELDKYKSEYRSKLNELEYEKRMLSDRKEYLEKYEEKAIR